MSLRVSPFQPLCQPPMPQPKACRFGVQDQKPAAPPPPPPSKGGPGSRIVKVGCLALAALAAPAQTLDPAALAGIEDADLDAVGVREGRCVVTVTRVIAHKNNPLRGNGSSHRRRAGDDRRRAVQSGSAEGVTSLGAGSPRDKRNVQ